MWRPGGDNRLMWMAVGGAATGGGDGGGVRRRGDGGAPEIQRPMTACGQLQPFELIRRNLVMVVDGEDLGEQATLYARPEVGRVPRRG